MVRKKKHHYIPRFYLKRFSVNNEGKLIGLYNLENGLYLNNAEMRHQGYENFLYGEDEVIEDYLANMEGNVATMFNYWTEEKLLYPPPPESDAFKLLKQFILYQSYRTPKSGINLMSNIDNGVKAFSKEFDPAFWESIQGYKISHKNPVLLSLANSIGKEHVLDSLVCKLLVNLSPVTFITSDAPVILYNQLLERAKNYVGATGLMVKGLQIFYPIHPRIMICLYDPLVYDFGNGCINCCSTESISDINQLNGLQLINCKSQLFFDESIGKQYISKLSKTYQKYRGSSKNIHKAIHQEGQKLFFVSHEDVQISLALSFYRLRVRPKHYSEEIAPLRKHAN